MSATSELYNSGFWTRTGPALHTVVSTMVRLSRNIPALPFPALMSTDESGMVLQQVSRALEQRGGSMGLKLNHASDMDHETLVLLNERGIITEDMIDDPRTGFAHTAARSATLLVNSRDHVRIRVLLAGHQVRQAWETADTLDTMLNEHIPWSFYEPLGYLTSQPENRGTGMKCTAMLHLPALSRVPGHGDMIERLKEYNCNIKQLVVPENNTSTGFYLLTHRPLPGMSEEDAVSSVNEAVAMVTSVEEQERDLMFQQDRTRVEDMVWRSLGTLTHARSITLSEAMEHLSLVRLGIVLALVDCCDMVTIHDLMVRIQPGHMKALTRDKTDLEEPAARAKLIREKLSTRK